VLKFNILSSIQRFSVWIFSFLQSRDYPNILQISLPCEKDRSEFAICNMLQLILSFWQPFCLHFTEILSISHFHSLFSMHTSFQLTYCGFLIIFFQEERQVKICFWLLYFIFENIPAIFLKIPSCCRLTKRRWRWHSARAQQPAVGAAGSEVLSNDCLFYFVFFAA